MSFDLLQTEQVFFAFATERVSHFMNNIDPFPLAENAVLYVVTNYLENGSGQFSLGSPLLTAYIPTFIGFSLLCIQFAGNIILNKWWARGNLYLLSMQVYSIAQYWAMT